MKKLFFISILFICSVCYAQPRGGTPPTRFQEKDGSPSLRARTIIVPNTVISQDTGVSDRLELILVSPASADVSYLRLDCSNDPLTGDLAGDTATFTGTGSFDALTLTGDTSIVSSAHEIDMKPSGDTDDYIRFKTVGDIPYIERKGGDVIHLISDGNTSAGYLCYEGVGLSGGLYWSKFADDLWMHSSTSIHIFPTTTLDIFAGDVNDYIRFQTADSVPEITTVGDCDLKISATGGDIDFDDENLKTIGDIKIASTSSLFRSGIGILDPEYTFGHDGSDAVHTITAGDFVFTGGNVGIETTTPPGTFTIDDTVAEALLVTQNADAADVFIVDTNSKQVEVYDFLGVGMVPTNVIDVRKDQNVFTRIGITNQNAGTGSLTSGTNLRFYGTGGDTEANNYFDNYNNRYVLGTFQTDSQMELQTGQATRMTFESTADGADIFTSAVANIGLGTGAAPICPVEIHSTLNAYTDTDEPENYALFLRKPTSTNNAGIGIAFLISSLADDVGSSIICKRIGSNHLSELQFHNKLNTTGDGAITEQMTLESDGSTTLYSNLKIGVGTAATDYTLTFDGETNDGVLTWMEDEDAFYFDKDIGIGVSDPVAALEINPATTSTEALILQATTTIGTATADGGNTGVDDCTSGGTFIGAANLSYKIEIDGGDPADPNTFRWSDDGGGTWDVSGVNITGAAQTLNNGVTITFGATTGHDTGDFWTFTATAYSGNLTEWQNAAETIFSHVTDRQFFAPDGGVLVGQHVPGIAFQNFPNTGIGAITSNLGFWESGNVALILSDSLSHVRIPSDYSYGWSAATDNSLTADTTIYRNAATQIRTAGSMIVDGTLAVASTTFNAKLVVNGNVRVGEGGANLDYYIAFDGETNDGTITFMEEENLFIFSDDIQLSDNEKLLLGTKVDGDAWLYYDADDVYLDISNATPTAGTPDIVMKLNDAAGASIFYIFDSGDNPQFAVTSDGVLYNYGGAFIGDAGVTNYAQFAADGELTLVGTARVKKNLIIPIEAAQGASAPTARVTEAPFLSWTFAVNDDTNVSFEVPHDMDFTQDTNIYVEWYTSADQTDDEVNWEIDWNAKAEGEAVNVGTTTDTSGDQVCPTQWQLEETLTETIAGNSIVADDILGLELKRVAIVDGTNPAVNTIHVLAIHIEYVANKFGEAT